MKQNFIKAGKASWNSRNKTQQKAHIKRMNEARIKAMKQNKEDAENYRKLKLAEAGLKDK